MSGPVRHPLDASRGGPLAPAAEQALSACGEAAWADPQAVTGLGRRAADLLHAACDSLARGLGRAGQVTHLTPGGGHAVSAGLVGLIDGQRARHGTAPTLVVSAVDHSAALRVARWWGASGGRVVTVGVDRLGRWDPEEVAAAAADGPSVACLQMGNGEVGTLQAVGPALTALTGSGAAVLLDATASAGRVPLPPGGHALAADAVTWGGPRGTGVLLTDPTGPWRARQPEQADESAVGPVVAAAAALEAALAAMPGEDAHSRGLTALLRRRLPELVDDLDVPGDPEHRLPHVLTVSALYADGESLVRALDSRGVAVGSGSACANDSGEPSHVLAAMGALTGGNMRVFLPLRCPTEAVDRLIEVYPEAMAEVRGA